MYLKTDLYASFLVHTGYVQHAGGGIKLTFPAIYIKNIYLSENSAKSIFVSVGHIQSHPLSLGMNLLTTLWTALVLLAAPPADTLRVMFWNLENFFDYKNDSLSASDEEFSARGARHWTKKRFQTKCNAVAKGILWAGSEDGGLPDAIGFAEVENAFVLRRLVQTTALRKLDYRIVHFESPDPRGIDVTLLYRPSRLLLADAKPCHLYQNDSIMRTRDILLARFHRADGADIAFLVNHHPSKYGGVEESEPRRRAAVERLAFLADSLRREGVENIVAMGDFNDTPDNPVYGLLEPFLVNLGLPLHQNGEGTIKYDGAWELIDLFFVSPPLGDASAMKILQLPFLMTKDTGHAGTKPLRTYSGPRYLGGVSDHCPVWLNIYRP